MGFSISRAKEDVLEIKFIGFEESFHWILQECEWIPKKAWSIVHVYSIASALFERHEKTCLRGFWPGETQLQRLARVLNFWI